MTDTARSAKPAHGVRDPHPNDNLELLTLKARMLGQSVEEPFATLLGLLEDYTPSEADEPEARWGATYRTLSACAYGVGLQDKRQRAQWYRLARAVPFTEVMARHILYTLRPELRGTS